MSGRKPSLLFVMLILLIMTTSACGASQTAVSPSTAPGPTQAQTTSAAPTSSLVSIQQQGVLPPPNLPDKRADQAGDTNSSITSVKKVAPPGSDTFVSNIYERPFNTNTMDTYFPYIDIVDTQGFIDNTWGYATITLSGADANGHLPAKYGVELDLNRDGRGDWLIIASNPSSTDWSTQGVQAWKDTDGDVGGTTPIHSDNASTGDGYETLVFDQGKSSDNPDGAWVRISSTDNKTVQLAFKLSMLGGAKLYAMGAWAGTDINPAMFDLNDHMTHVQAGDPDPGIQLYPIKSLSEIDNTCRLAIGFIPTGSEPGLCLTILKQKRSPELPAPPPPPKPGGNPTGGNGG